jgi:retron-type reverse transcriptase
MKRYGDLWPRITDAKNIAVAFERAACNKHHYRAVRDFTRDAPVNLASIRASLLEKTFHTAPYREKTVYEPKERTIYVLPFAPDRIVQHALMNVIAPLWEKFFIDDSYACRVGKGIHAGSQRTMEYVRRNKYCLKCDIHHFYSSVDHEILFSIIEHKIKDKDTLWLIRDIIDSYPGGKNVPIGNYTSQWFGNLYLNELDRFVKEDLHIDDYLRYCDDFCLFSDDKALLREAGKRMGAFLKERLALEYSKCDLFPVSRGVDFLGYRHFENYILVRKTTARRIQRRIRRLYVAYQCGQLPVGKWLSILASAWGCLSHANTSNLRRALNLKALVSEAKMDNSAANRPVSDVEVGSEKSDAENIPRFSDFADSTSLNIMDGKKLSLDSVLDKEIVVLKYRVKPTKYAESKAPNCITVQFYFADEAAQTHHVFFSGSSVLIGQMEKYKEHLPFRATVRKVGKYFTFT